MNKMPLFRFLVIIAFCVLALLLVVGLFWSRKSDCRSQCFDKGSPQGRIIQGSCYCVAPEKTLGLTDTVGGEDVQND